MDENTPSWIRDLYRDIYPNITTPSQGRRIPWGGANGPAVNAFRQRSAMAPKMPPLQQNANPWQATVTPEPPAPPGPYTERGSRHPLDQYTDRTNRFGSAEPPPENSPLELPPPSITSQAGSLGDLISHLYRRNRTADAATIQESGLSPTAETPGPYTERGSRHPADPLGGINRQGLGDLPPNIPGRGYTERPNRFGSATPPLENTSPNLPPPSTLSNATDPLSNIPSPFDLLYGAMRGVGENSPFLSGMRDRNLERRAQRRPYTFTHGSGHIAPGTDILNPLSIQDLLDALRGGREQDDPRRN